ncbi:DUF3108 domain-containing protein [Microbulbifer sp. SAOS-129_SWC]|uniref:DUF3108 domain-containing protein n=1 Tax=Microbulbifer sp. SAOS-129_SWC TaxID=3145235 RepID=UPI003217A2AC
MPVRILTFLFLCLIAVLPAQAADQPQLKPFVATYTAHYGAIGVTAKRRLSGSDGSWRLDFDVDSLFAGIREFSRFRDVNGQLHPQHYEYHKTGLGRDRHTRLNFEQAEHRVVNLNRPKRTLDNVPRDVHDKLTYQLQLALDVAAGKKNLNYQIADGKRLNEYNFAVDGREMLRTPLGEVETVRVKRVPDGDSDRETSIWFAPQWNYALVKLMQSEDGKTYQIELTELSIDGKSVGARQ